MKSRYYHVSALALVCGLSTPVWAAGPIVPGYDKIIAAARAGNTAPAMVQLHNLYTAHPKDRKLVYDYIVVSTWAGDDTRAIKLYDVLSNGKKPAYVIAAAAKAARNLKNYPKALALYNEGLKANPRDAGMTAGKIMVLADMDRAADAKTTAAQAMRDFKGNVDIILAAGYAAEARGADIDAIALYQQAAQLAPNNTDVTRRLTLAMSHTKLHEPALVRATDRRAAFSDNEYNELQGQAASELVRLGEVPRAYPVQRYAVTDAAIARLTTNITAWQQAGGNEKRIRQARFDRMTAYRDRNRMQDVIDEYDALRADNPDIPVYVLQAVADAYLDLRQPEQSLPLYQTVVAAQPNNWKANSGLFYSYLETEDFDDALALADRLDAAEPPLPNPKKLRTAVLAARARQYADDTPDAEQRMAAIAAAMPGRPDITTAMGDVYNAQGRPMAAAAQYKTALAQDPDSFGTLLGAGNNNLALRDFPTAAAQSNYLTGLYPDNRGVQRLARLNEIENRPELVVRAGQTYRSNTVNDLVGRGGFTVGSRLYSPPINYYWRPYVGFDYTSDKIQSGNVENTRYVGGVQYRDPRWIASAELSQNNFTNDGSRVGAMAEAAYTFNDQWQAGARGEIFSADTPLRALRDGITASGGSMFAVYQPYETRRFAARVGLLEFTDDNTRLYATGSWVERVKTYPHFKIDWRTAAYASHNSEDDNVPYYNPKTDLLLTTGPEFIHTLYRRYQFSWDQRLSLQPGYYYQENHSSGFSGNATYQQRVRMNDDFDGGVGVSYGRQLYDGDGENAATIFADLDWKL